LHFKGILFDLDGTLLDTTELIIKSFQHTIDVNYNRPVDLEIVRAYFGKPLRAALEVLGPGDVDKLIHTYREFNLQHHDELAKIFAGVAQTIQELYSAGVLLAVVTSKTHTTAIRGLKLFDMDKYFPVVIGCEQCQNHKPHPEPVQLALAGLGLWAGDCLMVGDSPADILSAQAAGVKTAAVRWSALPIGTLEAVHPDFILDTMADLLCVSGVQKK
jgi:pyrophosphatase PpaX